VVPLGSSCRMGSLERYEQACERPSAVTKPAADDSHAFSALFVSVSKQLASYGKLVSDRCAE
jgi:hypothetical protein